MKNDIRERHAVLQETSSDYAAQLGDTLTVRMRSLERGTKSDSNELLASGERVPVRTVFVFTYIFLSNKTVL